MAEHRSKVNRLDRLLLAGRDPDRAITMLDYMRMVYALIFGLVLIAALVGYFAQVQRNYAHSKCVERNAQAVVSRQVLAQLINAATVDKDRNQAKVWQQWLTVSNKTMPNC